MVDTVHDVELSGWHTFDRAVVARHQGGAVLDVGCGSGVRSRCVFAAADRYPMVLGVDRCGSAIAAAARAAPNHHHYRHVSVDQLDAVLGPATFDVVLAANVPDQVTDPAATVVALATRVHRGGVLVVRGEADTDKRCCRPELLEPVVARLAARNTFREHGRMLRTWFREAGFAAPREHRFTVTDPGDGSVVRWSLDPTVVDVEAGLERRRHVADIQRLVHEVASGRATYTTTARTMSARCLR